MGDEQHGISGGAGGVSNAAIYRTSIGHGRIGPIKNRFTYASYQWLVDLDQLPHYGPFAKFRAADHVGDRHRSIKQNIEQIGAERGLQLDGGPIMMLTNARTFGYVFNPISVFWCFGRDAQPRGVVIEVHNTYGERTAYVAAPDQRGHATFDKHMYVSPFNDVSGEYEVRVPVPDDSLNIVVSLRREDQPPFVATMSGTRTPANWRSVLWLALRRPLEPLWVSARIYWQGIKLWSRRVPISPRPKRTPPKSTDKQI